MFYWIAVAACYLALNLYYNIKVEGAENLPKNRPLILISNHTHLCDPVVLAITLPRQLSFMAKQELFENPFMRILLPMIKVFAVNRESASGDAIKKSRDILEKGGAVGIFPEGTRYKGDGSARRPKAGAAYLAINCGADVLPAWIEYENGTKFRAKITVRYGKPVSAEEFKNLPAGKDGIRAATELTFGKVLELSEKRDVE